MKQQRFMYLAIFISFLGGQLLLDYMHHPAYISFNDLLVMLALSLACSYIIFGWFSPRGIPKVGEVVAYMDRNSHHILYGYVQSHIKSGLISWEVLMRISTQEHIPAKYRTSPVVAITEDNHRVDPPTNTWLPSFLTRLSYVIFIVGVSWSFFRPLVSSLEVVLSCGFGLLWAILTTKVPTPKVGEMVKFSHSRYEVLVLVKSLEDANKDIAWQVTGEVLAVGSLRNVPPLESSLLGNTLTFSEEDYLG